jgi:hypothetical protein
MFGSNSIDDDSNSIFDDDSSFDFSLSASSHSFSYSISSILLKAIIENEHVVFMNSKRTYEYLQFEDEVVIEDLLDNDDDVIKRYRFRKRHIEIIANLLWNKFGHLFNGPYEKIILTD